MSYAVAAFALFCLYCLFVFLTSWQAKNVHLIDLGWLFVNVFSSHKFFS